jgi:multidrug efflux pump
MALSFTPALCATLLKPVQAGHAHAKTGFFGWFNRGFSRTARGYEGLVKRMLRRAGASWLILYAVVVGALVWMFGRLPTSFLPNEDQGNLLVNVQLPPGATQARTLEVMKQVEGYMLKQPEVQSMVSVLGFSFSGSGQNAALGFVTLKDWDLRPEPGQSAQALAGRAFGALAGIRDAFIFPSARRRSPSWAAPTASRCACRTAVAPATQPCWPRATSWSAPRRRARCCAPCGPTAWKTRRSCS